MTQNKLYLLLIRPNQTKSISLRRLKDNDENILYDVLFQFGCDCKRIGELKLDEIGIAAKAIGLKSFIQRKKRINEINQTVIEIKEMASDFGMMKKDQEMKCSPSPSDIAEYMGIRISYIKMLEDIPSYLSYKELTIFISDQYINNQFIVEKLIARELGHFLLDDRFRSIVEMNASPVSLKNNSEYEANVFAILLMPQIMRGEPWEMYTPRFLNRKIYNEIVLDEKFQHIIE